MRAVVDTNILIRAVIRPQGTVGPVLARLRTGDCVLVYSEAILEELVEKLALPRLRRKYALDDKTVEAVLALIALRGELVAPTRSVAVCRDPDDDRIIEAALAGEAAVVVTGDEDLLTLKVFENVAFITPGAFLKRLDQPEE